jgi:hypothetical protein
MLVSMMIAGIASQFTSPRTIGLWAGAFSTTTALYWWWAMRKGRLREPDGPARAAAAEEEYGDHSLESRG